MGLENLKSIFSPTAGDTKFQDNQTNLKKFDSIYDDGLNVPSKSNLLTFDSIYDDGLIKPITSLDNLLNIDSHGYDTGEIIRYSYEGGSNTLSGLSTTTDYYVSKLDDNNFRLCLVGSGDTTNYYLDNSIYVSLGSTGTGSFNYKPITVNIDGNIGIATLTGQDFRAKVQPRFRGKINSIDLTNNGTGYGSSEVINLNRQPEITFQSGITFCFSISFNKISCPRKKNKSAVWLYQGFVIAP